MSIKIRAYQTADLEAMLAIWNQVVEQAQAFPQDQELDLQTGRTFFENQIYTGLAQEESGDILGLYILHANSIGRCGHIANASYAVAKGARGQGIGRKLVFDSLKQAKKYGFRIMQFNAVLASNSIARKLYEDMGFQQIGTIPQGFRHADNSYEAICPYYYDLTQLTD